jgi:hypothetical protein
MKKCQNCGTISQDADPLCGVCGSNIGNTPTLTGSIEDEILKDRKSSEEESNVLQQGVAGTSSRGLARRLLPSSLALTIGFALILYGLFQSLSLGNIDSTLTYSSVDTPLVIEVLLMIGGFAFVIAGFNFGIKGVTSGASPRESDGMNAVPTSSYEFSAASTMSMRATYEGQFLPKEKPNAKKP